MSNITINDDGSQENHQKTTPVKESSFEPNYSSISLPGCVLQIWLGLSDLFQTFEDLESVVDKEAEIANIRELLDESDSPQNDAKEPLC